MNPAFFRNLAIDTEIFDFVAYDCRWVPSNESRGSEQEEQADQGNERNRIDGGSSYNY